MKNNLTFAELGEIFDDATTRMVGGVSSLNKAAILNDISRVQSGLASLLNSHPEDFQGVAGIHAQNIVDQLNLEKAAIKSVGSDPFAAKYINDVQCDLIDIVQGDETLAALATKNGHNGFAAVPDLLAPPAQFQGNATQTEFMTNFITTTQDFAARAEALVGTGNQADINTLIGEIKTYGADANAFTTAQGGLYSARFNNEFASDGVHGTASRVMIDGLLHADVAKVKAAAEVMSANAADVAGNMLGVGDDPPPVANPIPANIDTLAVAGQVFNDATTKLIGGIYDGNRQSIHDDLTATREAVVGLLNEGKFDGQAKIDAQRVAALLGAELKAVDSGSTGPLVVLAVNKLHQAVINTVQNDPVLAAAAGEDDASGFAALPGTLKGHLSGPSPDPHGHGQHDTLAHIFSHDDHHHMG